MFVTDAISMDDYGTLLESPVTSNKLIQESVATLCIGEHGEEYRADPITPADHQAILSCGHSVLFPTPPVTGESLYCFRCDNWLKCRVVGGYLVRCLSCDWPQRNDFGYDSSRAWSIARKHAIGSKGGRKDATHNVEVGRYTIDSVIWKKYIGRVQSA